MNLQQLFKNYEKNKPSSFAGFFVAHMVYFWRLLMEKFQFDKVDAI